MWEKIYLEKKKLKNLEVRFCFINSELTSSALANNVFNYLNEDVKKTINKLDKNNLTEKFNLLLKKNKY